MARKTKMAFEAQALNAAAMGLSGLAARPVGQTPEEEAISFKVARILRQLTPEAEVYQMRRTALMRECGAQEGQGRLFFDKLNEQDEFTKRATALDRAIIPMNIEPLSWKEAKGLGLSVSQVVVGEGILFTPPGENDKGSPEEAA